MFAMIAMMMVGMATVGGGGCEAGEMLPLLKRHEIQILLSVGMPSVLVAERVGVSVDTVERVRDEAPVTHVDDAAERRARGLGRPSKASRFADEVRSWLEPEPPDGGGGAPTIREGVAKDRTISLSDPDMRHGRKSKSRTFNGFKSHLATDLDVNLVLAATVLAANQPERDGLDAMREDLLRVVRRAQVTELHTDRAYTDAELTRELAAAGTEVITKPRPIRGRAGLYDRSDFIVDLRKKTATCPDGQTVPIELGEVAHFDGACCARCPQRAACTEATLGRGRSLSIPADEPMQRRFAKLAGTSTGRARLRERVAIEHALARHAAVQGTKARYRGARKNVFDARRVASVMNLECAHRNYADAA
jgi:hypothetical protein